MKVFLKIQNITSNVGYKRMFLNPILSFNINFHKLLHIGRINLLFNKITFQHHHGFKICVYLRLSAYTLLCPSILGLSSILIFKIRTVDKLVNKLSRNEQLC